MANIITKDNVKISICFSLIIIVPIVITIISSSVMLITFTFCHLYPSDLHLVLPSSQLCKKIKGKKWILIHQPSAKHTFLLHRKWNAKQKIKEIPFEDKSFKK